MTDPTMLPDHLQAIDRTRLTPLVRQLFRSDAVEVLDWQIDRINFDHFNLFTDGLYRISGTAQENKTTKVWSMVLKIVHGLAFVPEDLWKNPSSFLYFKRESLAYNSDLRSTLPECISMPRCYEVTMQPDNTEWLWIEDITDCYPSGWPLDRFVLAGRHLGIFNGKYLTGLTQPDYPWLVDRNFLRAWNFHFLDVTRLERIQDNATWEHPMVRCAFPTPIAERFLKLGAKSNLLMDMLDRLPQTLCHLDAQSANLFARRNEDGHDQTVMIDWASTGINVLGLELVQLLWPYYPKQLLIWDRRQIEVLVFENYVAGLREAGWYGDETLVRFGYLASVFCRQGTSRMDWVLELALDKAKQIKFEQEQHRPVTEILTEKGAEVYTYLDRGEEALRLLDTVSALL